jgi:hypothetical protein
MRICAAALSSVAPAIIRTMRPRAAEFWLTEDGAAVVLKT